MRRRNILGWLSAANAVAIVLIWMSNRFASEASWFTMLVGYVPQLFFMLPVLVACLWSGFAKRWKILGLQIGIGCFAVFFLLGLELHPFRQGAGPSLRVLTFNVELTQHGLANVVATIREQKPDVICLQECNSSPDHPIVDLLRRAMPEFQMTYGHGLVIGSRLPLLGSRVIPLDPSRPMLEAIVEWRGKQVKVANVHLIPIFIDRYLLESPGIIPDHLRLAGAERDRQLAQLLAYSDSVRSPLVLCGDTNAPGVAGFHRRLSHSLNDAFAATGTGFGYTIPASFPLMRLDYVYVNSGLTPNSCWVAGRIASDHRAVVADLSLP